MQEGGRRRRGARSRTAVLDHLDGKLQNNNYANLTLAHPQCVRARSDNPEYQNIAGNKKVENAAYVPLPDKHASGRRGGKEGKANDNTFALIERHLGQEVGNATRAWDDLCYSIVFKIGKEEGRSIHIRTVEMYVRALCTRDAPWQITGSGDKRVVSRRPRRRGGGGEGAAQSA